jgi:hypothetical protein
MHTRIGASKKNQSSGRIWVGIPRCRSSSYSEPGAVHGWRLLSRQHRWFRLLASGNASQPRDPRPFSQQYEQISVTYVRFANKLLRYNYILRIRVAGRCNCFPHSVASLFLFV